MIYWNTSQITVWAKLRRSWVGLCGCHKNDNRSDITYIFESNHRFNPWIIWLPLLFVQHTGLANQYIFESNHMRQSSVFLRSRFQLNVSNIVCSPFKFTYASDLITCSRHGVIHSGEAVISHHWMNFPRGISLSIPYESSLRWHNCPWPSASFVHEELGDHWVGPLKLAQNCHHFADCIFKYVLNESLCSMI